MLEELKDRVLGLDTLLRHLGGLGLTVKRAKMSPATLELTGRTVKRVTISLAGSNWGFGNTDGHTTVSVGPVPLYASRSFPVQLQWWVPMPVGCAPRDFTTALKLHRSGFLWRGEVQRAEWKGGSLLAAALGADAKKTLALARALELGDGLSVKLDADLGALRVVHQTRVVTKFSVFANQVLDVERRLPSATLVAGIEWLAKTAQALAKPASKPKRPKKPAQASPAPGAPARKRRARRAP